MIRMVPGLMFMFLCGVLLLVLMRMEKPAVTPDNPLVGVAMPSLPLIDAKSADAALGAADYKGKVTVINFFASWCNPCAMEMGELVKLHQENPKVRFIGVAWNDGPAAIAPWLAKHGDPFGEVRYDDSGRAAMSLGLRGIPETFIVDAHGIVRCIVPGTVTPDMRTQKLTPLLKQLEAADAS